LEGPAAGPEPPEAALRELRKKRTEKKASGESFRNREKGATEAWKKEILVFEGDADWESG
jgi:hypothetical protein